MSNDEMRLKYLDMIQAVVLRMASNQFQARAWSVSLNTALLVVVTSKDGKLHGAWLSLLLAGVFWCMDAYFLAAERKYRHLYSLERVLDGALPSMDLSVGAVSLKDLGSAAKSLPVLCIHPPVMITAIAIATLGALFFNT